MRLITWWCFVRRPKIHLANRYDCSVVHVLCGLSLERMTQLRNPAFISKRNICKRCKLIDKLQEAKQ